MRNRFPAAAAAVALAALTACTGTEQSADGPPVLAPGAPGESASPASQQQLDAAAEGLEHNKADIRYIVAMIGHHKQALVMTDLADDRMADSDLGKIADRIASAQEPEIEAMEAWLDDNVYGSGEDAPDSGACFPGSGHGGGEDGAGGCPVQVDHDDMAGMADREELDALEQAEGAEFDTMFVDLMTTHHEGAVTMAEEAALEGEDPVVLRMADDVVAEQTADIDRMDQVLDG
ncbi:DUF305 domain-containing protein [Streptomonospora salina]|uniref:Uncharacterized protein (DUF305 family) n=1 Tax=Streptomonospora salina TaxID=104205 RepID=A0A841EJ04_9ACTN|nr:DUF305 domain-containing protein [Streptomonospora salina]MBB6000340.1 uncharacterized protein (DUF305 family) [Streptomonospora salina]